MEDTMDMLDEDDIEEEAEEEVDKVLYEITNGLLGEAGPVGGALEVCVCVCFGCLPIHEPHFSP